MKLTFLLLITSLAQAETWQGSYKVRSGLLFPSSAEACNEEKGQFSPDSTLSLSGVCTVSEGVFNTIEISLNERKQSLVKVDVIYGSYNMRSFTGLATHMNGDKMVAREAVLADNGSVRHLLRNGCALTLTLKNGALSLGLGSHCDSGLARATGAKKP